MNSDATSTVHAFDIELQQEDGYRFKVRFDKPPGAVTKVDEGPPLGKGEAPNPARLLAAALGSCLSASLVFCLRRHANITLAGLRTRIHVEIVRNEHKRQRIGKVRVVLLPPLAADDAALAQCRDLFEDYCTVTQSVRDGIDVEVAVEATRSPA